MLLEFDDGRIVEVPSSLPGWSALAEAIDSLAGARRFGEWHADDLAAPLGDAIAVWSREGVDGQPAAREAR